MQIITLTRVNNPLDRSDQDRIEYEFVPDNIYLMIWFPTVYRIVKMDFLMLLFQLIVVK